MRPLVVLALLLLAWPTDAIAAPVDRWAAEIRDASARFAIPERWIRLVMKAESGGRASVDGRPITSRAGAMGLMQVMPATWLEMRAAHGLGSNPYEPRDNILAGAAYLRAMYDRFGYPGLFAAYNAGPARYASYLAARQGLPAETRAYVARITGLPVERAATPGAIAVGQAGRLFVRLPPRPAPSALLARDARAALFVPLSTASKASE